MPSNKAQSEDRKGRGEIQCILRLITELLTVIQGTGNTVDTYTLPGVHVPSCENGSICAQQHPSLQKERKKNLSVL